MTQLRTTILGLVALSMLIGALWVWQHATRVLPDVTRPEVMAWGMRCAAVALATGAQVLLVGGVLDSVYGRERLGALVRWSAGAACAGAVVSAMALGLAGW